MALWTLLTLVSVVLIVEAKWSHHSKRETTLDICAQNYNNTNKVQCFCVIDNHITDHIRSADCYLTSNIEADDRNWDKFNILRNISKLTITNAKEVTLMYVPTNALKHTTGLLKLDIKYANIDTIQEYAFANLSSLEEITLRDDQIKALEANAFAHLKELTTIGLDKNNLVEINRNVFVDLPSLEKLFLTSNKITTIHDRAFIHLINLRELEIDRNNLFSLNSETFVGLRKLQKLDLSSNSLEVIGDNTFVPLVNLRSLNLAGNKIQMLDGKAFNGLAKMQSLSLARNNLTSLDNVKIFEGLDTLNSLSLRGNKISELKTEVMAPVLSNFYNSNSNLDVEENNFPCDCRLDWFMSLMNKTQNNHLRLTIENLKCNPDTKLREMWMKIEETEKGTGQVFEDEESQVQNTDYEYYDDTQLDGRLFYIDVRHLLNCTNTIRRVIPEIKSVPATTAKGDIIVNTPDTSTVSTEETTRHSSEATSSPILTSESTVTSKASNLGLLELSDDTTSTIEVTKTSSEKSIEVTENKPNPTTSRLATVSANPIQPTYKKNVFDDRKKNMFDERDMASDEAKPDKLKTHRSIHDDINEEPFRMNSAIVNVGCVPILIVILFFTL